ncbi:MAG: U32 family peptidase [Deltaproteobacteria bacterium]|nr:U32 family peptidase [Deltaproteobacteria bacterium]
MELTLGPVLFEWKREEILRFYEEAADMDLDMVYVGEVVCTKKLGLNSSDLERIITTLEKGGKKVALSSLAIVSNEEELDFTRRLLSFPNPIEANDVSVFNMADPAKREVFAGPHITSYNLPTVEFLESIGVKRVTFPVELSKESIAVNLQATGISGEVFAHGKVPLAFSWRCYTSRAYGLTKTECRHHCAKYPDGMELRTADNARLFTVNGTSVLSAASYTLVEFVEEMKDIGVKALRVSPQHKDTSKVVDVFRKRITGAMEAGEGLSELKALGGELCNGWYLGGAGKDYLARIGA